VLDRMAHAIHGAQMTGSNILYDVTDTSHDPTQGFFFKNIETGDESFAWPMPAQFQKFLTMGMATGESPQAMFPAPVSGLNLIGQVQPGFGPVVTGPASQFLDHPGWREDVLNFMAPFGGPSIEDSGGLGNAIVDSVTPAWLRKFATAVFPVTPEQKSQLAAAQQSAMIYLASTGNYDMGNEDDMARLLANGQTMARRLYMLRAIGQFVLPTMGAPEQTAITGNGELVFQSKLAGILRDYQNDPAEGGFGYQQGFLNFLRDYGSDLYLMGVDKTNSYGFGQPTHATYNWMRNNADLMTKYDRVWGLLVPNPGDDFYYPAYQAQIRRGYRTLIDPKYLVEQANDRLARALYTSYRAQVGDSPTEAQSAELAALQGKLETQFPGYSRIPDLGSGTNTLILELERAAADPKVAASPVGPSLTTYFAARAQIKASGATSLRTGTGRELAPSLYSLGQQLAASDPSFRLAWDRLLSYEFDSAQFSTEATTP